MKLNCVIVDDSSIQRIVVAKLANSHANLQLVGEFSNAIEARSCITTQKVDLIFLDIEMPVINGFAFIDGLKEKAYLPIISIYLLGFRLNEKNSIHLFVFR